jgi:hypothetical protein
MLKTATLLVLVAVIAGLTGCASSKSPSASAPTGPIDVSGTWTGNTQTSARTITMQLKQTGKNVAGTLEGAGVLDGAITGVVEGNTIQFAERTGIGTTPWLNVKGDQMSGDLGSGQILTLRRVGK